MQQVVHTSAHPNLQPVHGEQVVQYLLAKNMYLTALELLVESELAGNHEGVNELRAFFSDTEKFPPEDVSKYQHGLALDSQALAREREKKLQLVEYELRLAKEDLAELQRKFETASTTGPTTSSETRCSHFPDSFLSRSETNGHGEPTMAVATGVLSAVGGEGGELSSCVDALRPSDVRKINAAVLAYLSKKGYQPCAKMFQEEADISDDINMDADTLVRWFSCRFFSQPRIIHSETQQDTQASETNGHSTEDDTSDGSAPIQEVLEEYQRQVSVLQRKLVDYEDHISQLTAVLRNQTSETTRSVTDAPKTATSAPSTAADVVPVVMDLVPRLVPNLTSQSRMDLIPLVKSVMVGEIDVGARRSLLCQLFSLVANPDEVQRQAIVACCADLASTFGNAWCASELLPLCSQHVAGQSAEKRCLVGDMLGALVPHLDLTTQAHVVLTLLHRLTEDRLPEVRQSAVTSMTQLLAKLPYLKSYYLTMEDMMMTLIKDTSDVIHQAVISQLLPSLITWTKDPETITTSLLPKVITDVSLHLRQGVAQHSASLASLPSGSAQHSTSVNLRAAAAASLPSFSSEIPGLPMLTASASKRRLLRHANADFQAVSQLLNLYIALQPTLQASALKSCPPWAIEGAKAEVDKEAEKDLVKSDKTDEETDASATPPESPFQTPTTANINDYTPDQLFGTWAYNEAHMQWKSVQWVVQFLLPELLDTVKMIAVTEDTLVLRQQCARAFRVTCQTFGASFTRTALVPLFTCAAAAVHFDYDLAGNVQSLQMPSSLWDDVPAHLQETAMDLIPRNTESIQLCRERVLPMLFAAILPAASMLHSFLSKLSSPGGSRHIFWALENKQDLIPALSFASMFSEPMPDILAVLDDLIQIPNVQSGLCAVVIIQSLSPSANEEQLINKLLPSMVSLMGHNDPSVATTLHMAITSALSDILFNNLESSRVTDQVFVIYDSQINSVAVPYDVQMLILNVAARLTNMVGERASTTAQAAMQIEWVLQTAQSVTQQLVALSRSTEQLKQIASGLFILLSAVYNCHIRLPRLVTILHACLENLAKHRQYLTASQMEAMGPMIRDKGMGGGAGGIDGKGHK